MAGEGLLVVALLCPCGDNSGGFFYNNYPCVMPGIAMGRNMTFAIKAVKDMFQQNLSAQLALLRVTAPMVVTTVMTSENHIGSEPMACASGKKMGRVMSSRARASMSMPPTK